MRSSHFLLYPIFSSLSVVVWQVLSLSLKTPAEKQPLSSLIQETPSTRNPWDSDFSIPAVGADTCLNFLCTFSRSSHATALLDLHTSCSSHSFLLGIFLPSVTAHSPALWLHVLLFTLVCPSAASLLVHTLVSLNLLSCFRMHFPSPLLPPSLACPYSPVPCLALTE